MSETTDRDIVADMSASEVMAIRKAALDAALRCAQPGTHADFVMADARRFLVWLATGA